MRKKKILNLRALTCWEGIVALPMESEDGAKSQLHASLEHPTTSPAGEEHHWQC